MFEIDFLHVGKDEKGDAITMRFTRPDTGEAAVVVIDAGYEDDGDRVVAHVQRYYDTNYVDLVISTHPDEDHISGLGRVLRRLHVGELWIHRPDQHGHPGNTGTRPAKELTELADAQGALVREPFDGVNSLGQAVVVAGPSKEFYEWTLDEQARTAKAAAPPLAVRLAEATRAVGDRFLGMLPVEIPFDDAGGTNPRNNSAAIIDIQIEGRRLFLPSDAGVPAINDALDFLDSAGLNQQDITFFQIPHHGSRHNLNTDTIERLFGPQGQATFRTAYVNLAPNLPKNPSPRIINALIRRGFDWFRTGGDNLCHSENAPARTGYGPTPPLPPLDEAD